MSDALNNALLPDGLRDALPPDAAHEAAIVERLLQIVGAHGYERVDPPLVEFEDSLLEGAGQLTLQMVFTRIRRLWDVLERYAPASRPTRALTQRGAELESFMLEKEPPDLSNYLISPMPGLLIGVSVEEGHTVEVGQEIAIVEAMKMENVLHAPRQAVVKKVLAQVGESLTVDQPIIEFS